LVRIVLAGLAGLIVETDDGNFWGSGLQPLLAV
jgi:hypothetical protein